MNTIEACNSTSTAAVRTLTSVFTMQSGLAVHIRTLSTEDLPFFAGFREKIGFGYGGESYAQNATPPIPRAHPRWKDQLTLVTYARQTPELHHPSLLGAAQLYPCARLDHPHHAEAVIQVEPGSRDLGLETELMRCLMGLAREVEIRTVDACAFPEQGEMATLCRQCGYIPDWSGMSICEPAIWRFDVLEEGSEFPSLLR